MGLCVILKSTVFKSPAPTRRNPMCQSSARKNRSPWAVDPAGCTGLPRLATLAKVATRFHRASDLCVRSDRRGRRDLGLFRDPEARHLGLAPCPPTSLPFRHDHSAESDLKAPKAHYRGFCRFPTRPCPGYRVNPQALMLVLIRRQGRHQVGRPSHRQFHRHLGHHDWRTFPKACRGFDNPPRPKAQEVRSSMGSHLVP